MNILERVIQLENTNEFIILIYGDKNDIKTGRPFYWNHNSKMWSDYSGLFYTSADISTGAIAIALSMNDLEKDPTLVSVSMFKGTPYKYDDNQKKWFPMKPFEGKSHSKEYLIAKSFFIDTYKGPEGKERFAEMFIRFT